MSAAWPNKALAEVCEIKPSKGEAKRTLKDADLVSFVPMEDLGIDQKFFEQKSERKLGQVAASYTYFADGDVLLAKITPCFENGKLGIARGLTNGIGFGSSEYIVFRPGADLSNEYLYYFLLQDSFRADGINTMSGAVGHKRVSKEFIERYQIPLPPPTEQQRIVATLDEAFAGLATAAANAKKNLTNADELFDSHVHSVFEASKDWHRIRLAEVTERITKGSSPRWQGINYVDAPGVLFVTSENVGVNRLVMDERKYVEARFNEKDKKSILKKGDVLTNIVGASIGRTAIYDLDDLANINQAVCLIRCNDNALNNRYLSYLLNSYALRQFLHDNETNNARANLSLGFFAELEIPLPELSDQRNLVRQFDEMSNFVAGLQEGYSRKLDFIRDLRQSILQKAFSGVLTSPPSQAIREAAE